METNLNGYAVWMGVSWIICCFLFWLSLRKGVGMRNGRAAAVAAGTAVLGVILGLFGAKLLLFLFRIDYYLKQGVAAFWTNPDPEEMSYYGGMAGVCLAVALTALALKEKPVKILNRFAPAGALMAALARFGEYFLGLLGTRYIGEQRVIFPFAVSVEWDPEYTEYFLAVFFLEGVFSLAAAAFALKHRNKPHCFLRTVFYLCLPQILCESLRDSGIRWLFVHLEQLTCYLVVEGILIGYGVAASRKGRKNWMPALLGLVVCGLTIAEEFMLEGKIFPGMDIPAWLIYGLMAAGLIALAWAEHRGYRVWTSEEKQ